MASRSTTIRHRFGGGWATDFGPTAEVGLEPGGMMVLAERIRRDPRLMAPREIALNLSIYHRTAAKRNSDYRPMHCYLTPANWERVLELAGFSDFIVCPDLERLGEQFPQNYANVVMAEK